VSHLTLFLLFLALLHCIDISVMIRKIWQFLVHQLSVFLTFSPVFDDDDDDDDDDIFDDDDHDDDDDNKVEGKVGICPLLQQQNVL